MEQRVKMNQLLFTHLPSCVTAAATGRAHICLGKRLLRVEKQPENCHSHPPSQLCSVLSSILLPQPPPQCQGAWAVWQNVNSSLSKAVCCQNPPPRVRARGAEERFEFTLAAPCCPWLRLQWAFPSGQGQIPRVWSRKVNREGHCFKFMWVQGCVLRRGL